MPQLLRRVQAADGAGDGAEIIAREALRDVGEVKRLLRNHVENLRRERIDRAVVAGLAALAVDIIPSLGRLLQKLHQRSAIRG